jgi:glycerol-3-phosphate dehydrogenase (NAD(P)+)
MIAVTGAGAFGTALAVALARAGRPVTLWARDPAQVARMRAERRNAARLPGVDLPENVSVTAEIADLVAGITLLALPMQSLDGFLAGPGAGLGGWLVACAKGVDATSLCGPSAVIAARLPSARVAVLTGPGFAADIARGLPTALTLATTDPGGEALQAALATPVLRLYLSSDPTGAELGGALKNVIAIAAGTVMGLGLGESARAALITRGFAEMQRLAAALGARPETLMGLSGFGDLVLTCTSAQSRNFRFGEALGRGERFDPGVTVEGTATARAVARLAEARGLDCPVTATLARVLDTRLSPREAMQALLSRPLREE